MKYNLVIEDSLEEATIFDTKGKEVFKVYADAVVRVGKVIEYQLVIHDMRESYQADNRTIGIGANYHPLDMSRSNSLSYIKGALLNAHELINKGDTLVLSN